MRLIRGRGAHARVARGDQGQRPEALREEPPGRRGGRPRRDRGRIRQPLLPLPREGGRPGPAGREPLPRGERPGRARERRGRRHPRVDATTRTRPSASSSSCSPTRASASTPRRPRSPSTRWSRAIEPKKGLPPLDELQGPDIELGRPRPGAREDARAAERGGLHDVSGRAGGGSLAPPPPPLLLTRRGGRRRRARPAAARLPGRARGLGGDRRLGGARPARARSSSCSTPACSSRRSPPRRSRSACRSPGSSTRTDLPGRRRLGAPPRCRS